MKYLKSVLVFLLVFLGSVGTLSAKTAQYSIFIPAQFEEAMPFTGGMAAVKQDGKWGYINVQGEMIISPKYDYAGEFSEGLAIVATWISNNEIKNFYKLGIVDESGTYKPFIRKSGEEYIHSEYIGQSLNDEDLKPYNDGYTFIFTQDEEGSTQTPIFDSEGREGELPAGSIGIHHYTEGLLPTVNVDEKLVYVDKNGIPFLTMEENQYGEPGMIWPFNQGIAPVSWLTDSGERPIGFINKQGEVIIEPKYTQFWISDIKGDYIVFNEGLACVRDTNDQCGVIDKEGHTIIPFEYEDIKNYNEGLIPVKKDGKWGYINKDNECVVAFQYDEAISFQRGAACVIVADEMYWIDTEGNKIEGSEIIAKDNDIIEGNNYIAVNIDEPFVIKENDKYGYAILELEESEPVDESLLEGFIERFYETCLMRTPDAEGIAYWKEAFKKRRFTGASMAHFFVTNEEFKNRNLSDTEYIETMYRVFFDRDADQGGISYWQSCLDQGITRNYILAGFINSDEFLALCKDFGISRGSIVLDDVIDTHPQVTQFVYRFYERCMNRRPDEAGLRYWVNGLVEQIYTGTSMAESFTNTPEFENQDLSDEEYLEVLYRMFFNREGDESGKAYWLGVIANGSTRKYVTQSFVYSNEFQGICETYGIRYC